MMPLNYILRKYTRRYKFIKSKEKIITLCPWMFIKVFAKSTKELETLTTNNKNIQPGYRDGIYH